MILRIASILPEARNYRLTGRQARKEYADIQKHIAWL